MTRLSISRVWDETAALVKRDAGVLLLISFGLVALPSVIFQAMSPEVVPGQRPEGGAWMLLIIPVAALSIIGMMLPFGGRPAIP